MIGLLECLGVWGTIRLILSAYLFRREGQLIAVKVRGLPYSVALRARSTDILSLVQVFALQEYNFDEFAQARSVRQKCKEICAAGKRPLIIDCGANVGFASLWFAKRFPEAMIVAVEPSPDNFDLLRRNVAACARVTPIKAAIWDVPAPVRIVNPDEGAWIRQVAPIEVDCADPGPRDFEIDTVTIADIFGRFDDCVPFIVKIDIEGSEKALFRSNTGWLSRAALVAIEVHDRLQPFKRIGLNFYREISKHEVEMIFSHENIFVFFMHANDLSQQ